MMLGLDCGVDWYPSFLSSFGRIEKRGIASASVRTPLCSSFVKTQVPSKYESSGLRQQMARPHTQHFLNLANRFKGSSNEPHPPRKKA